MFIPSNVIFTDECSIMLEQHAKLCFRKRGDPGKLKPTVKHPYKVHVWGGISKRGATYMVIFDGIMESTFYVHLLQQGLVDFIRNTFPDGCRFQQDNDPKHMSIIAHAYFAEAGIPYWPTPAESPDLNPIEMLWHELKHHLRKRVKPTTKETLVNGIKQFWTQLTPERCTKYIAHLQKVLPAVLEQQGQASGY